MQFNKYQSSVEELDLDNYPEEVKEQFWDFIDNVPYIKYMVSDNRQRACDIERDVKGRIIVDITKPHILENMDYFRPSAIHYNKYGCYTNLRPNPNPNSEYGKWFREEILRCYYGYVRPTDGEWVTGSMYFFLNYCPISMTKTVAGSKKGKRVVDFPEFWEGIYYRFHYIEQAQYGGIFDSKGGNNGCEISARGKSKSYTMAAIMARNFVLGESKDVEKVVKSLAVAYQKQYLTSDGILNKFQSYIDFLAQNTQFPARRIKSSLQDMSWKMGYLDLNTGTQMGTLNEVLGVSAKDDVSKVRGKRQNFIVVEEFGSFRNVLELYNIMIPSVQEGDISFGTIYLIGTSGDDESDFQGASEIVYNPKGYRMYAIPNTWDKEGQGKLNITFFFPGYINRKGCYDKDGNSDVTKAILEILSDRYRVKYNSSDVNSITKTIAEIPITPQEAILRTRGNIFPVTPLNERLNQIDATPSFYDDVYVGDLIIEKNGEAKYVPTDARPIREFPLKDNMAKGAIEIYQMPEKNKDGKIYNDRYILGHDPVDNDQAESLSLTSTFVLDLFTDNIVAEYTGRQDFAEDNYEIVRRLCLFYNGKVLYEAHPYSQLVPTPNGNKLWGDIKIGDTLFAPNSTTVKVVDIPIDGEDDIYKITLQDGREVKASKNHIWEVYKLGCKNAINITTEKLVEQGLFNKHNQHQFYIPESGVIEYSHKDVPIDPYTMGLLIAEGAFTKFKKGKYENFKRRMIQISSSLKDMEYYKTKIPYESKYIGTKGYSWHLYIDNIDLILKELGLLHCDSSNKFIPDLYLYNDYNTRVELLRGLMDGDGCAVPQGASVFITASEKLRTTFMSLCRSLGMKTCENSGREKGVMYNKFSGKYYQTNKVYRVAIATTESIFNLPRKKEKQHVYKPYTKGSKASALLYKTAIEKIEYIGKEKCKCVTVSSKDGLYLIGDYIVTHNCNKKGLFSYFSKMNCLHLLADTPEYLRDKQLIKYSSFGSASKGVNASLPVNNFANTLIRDWLLKPVVKIIKEDGEDVEITVSNLFNIKSKALLKELVLFNPDINVDRIRALGMLMLYREEKMILYQGDVKNRDYSDNTYLGNDPFFSKNYDDRFGFNVSKEVY